MHKFGLVSYRKWGIDYSSCFMKRRGKFHMTEIMIALLPFAFTEVHPDNIQYRNALLYIKLALSESIYSLTPSQLQMDFISRYGRAHQFLFIFFYIISIKKKCCLMNDED